MDVAFVLHKYQEILMNSVWAIMISENTQKFKIKKLVKKKWKILTVCARIHGRKKCYPDTYACCLFAQDDFFCCIFVYIQ